MNIQSDKQIKIFNLIPIIFFNSKYEKLISQIAISLTNKKNKLNWVFFTKCFANNEITEYFHAYAQSKSNVLIIFADILEDKNFKYIKKLSYLFGKKIIIISSKNFSELKKDEFIFHINLNFNSIILEKKILNILTKI